jgi:hypothetical protein
MFNVGSPYSAYVPDPATVNGFAVGGDVMKQFIYGDQARTNQDVALALGAQSVAFAMDATLPGAVGTGIARVNKSEKGETFLNAAMSGQFHGSALGNKTLVAPAAAGMMFPSQGPMASLPMAQQSQVALANMLAQPVGANVRSF